MKKNDQWQTPKPPKALDAMQSAAASSRVSKKENDTMKIKVLKSERTTKDMDVEFPLYSRWGSDSSATFSRVDNNGLCISIGKDIGAWDEKFEGPAYEIKQTKIDLSHPLDDSYVSDGRGNKACTEAEFLAVFDEMIVAIQKTRTAIS